jgi:hypothetical protein
MPQSNFRIRLFFSILKGQEGPSSPYLFSCFCSHERGQLSTHRCPESRSHVFPVFDVYLFFLLLLFLLFATLVQSIYARIPSWRSMTTWTSTMSVDISGTSNVNRKQEMELLDIVEWGKKRCNGRPSLAFFHPYFQSRVRSLATQFFWAMLCGGPVLSWS